MQRGTALQHSFTAQGLSVVCLENLSKKCVQVKKRETLRFILCKIPDPITKAHFEKCTGVEELNAAVEYGIKSIDGTAIELIQIFDYQVRYVTHPIS